MASEGAERRLAAILSADAVGYSRLMAEDEAATVRTLTTYRHEISSLVGEHRGRVVDAPGDNLLAEFPTALDAVECAVEIQRVLKARNAGLAEQRRMEFRIGVHLGDIRAEGDRIYGDGVNIAARLEGLAEPGGICISATVHDQVEAKLGLSYEDLGEQSVKNIAKPVRVFRVGAEAQTAPTDAPARSLLRVALTLAVVVVVAVVVAAGWRMLGDQPPEPVAADISAPIRSIAVLPLENLTGDPEQEYFADGMTEALISEFAQFRSLRVISRTSVMQYKQAPKSLPEIARELNVDAVIEGTVLREGNRVRITTQLIDARNDQHLWADRFDRDLGSVLALHSDVARAVAEKIRLELTPQEEVHLAQARPVDPAAHDAYLRGIYHIGKVTVPNRLKASEYFEQAIELDPEHALAYAGLARNYINLGWGLKHLRPHEAMPKARAAASKALALDDSLARAHTALGMVLGYYDWKWERGEAELRRAVELSPSDPYCLSHYGYYLSRLGRHAEAFPLLERALEVESVDLTWRTNYALAFFFARDYERAAEEALEMLEVEPDFLWAHSTLFLSYQQLGREEEAYRAHTPYLRGLGRDEEWLRGRELAYREGGPLGAYRYYAVAEAERAKTQRVDLMGLGWVHMRLGEVDAAFEWLERAYEERDVELAPFMGGSPWFDTIRSDPRFQDLLRRMNYPGAS